MISFLIPVFNFDVRNLVFEIISQAEKNRIDYEIIVVDDNSEFFKKENSEITVNDKVYYEELNENIGRSRIRNYLAKKANYENLIFLDCDSALNPGFLKKYLEHIDYNVVYGGTIYNNNVEKKFYLHCLYGTTRESVPMKRRIESPILSFRTNNFMIKKAVFKNIVFDERLTGYGHEDTLFAIELDQLAYKIKHISNPVIHLGLEQSDIFIKKVLRSVENLHHIIYLKKELLAYFKKIKIIKYFLILKKIYLCGLFSILYNISNKMIIKILKSRKAKIFLLDYLKLTYICKKEKQLKQ